MRVSACSFVWAAPAGGCIGRWLTDGDCPDLPDHVEVARTEHLVLYAEPGSVADEDLERYVEKGEADAVDVAETLGVEVGWRASVWLVRRGEELPAEGGGVGMVCGPQDVWVSTNPWWAFRGTVRHEYAHIVVSDAWGPCARKLLTEGIAAYMESSGDAPSRGHVDGTAYDDLALALEDHDWIPLESLVATMEYRANSRNRASLVQYEAGAFVEYLWTSFGREAVQLLYDEACFSDVEGFEVSLAGNTGGLSVAVVDQHMREELAREGQ